MFIEGGGQTAVRKDSGAIVFLEEQFSKFVNDMGTNVALNFLQPVLQIP